jgi:glycosyltransferase involved in cell wall biosynthesis
MSLFSSFPYTKLMTNTFLHVFPTLAVGGQQTRFATVANGLGQAFRHLLISLDGRDAALRLLDPKLDFAVLPSPRAGHLIDRIQQIAAASTAANSDALVTYNWGAIEWAIVNLYLRLPHIHLEDGFGPEESYRQKRRRILLRRLALRGSLVVVPSRSLHRLARTTWKSRQDRLFYIPNGVDPTRFDATSRTGVPVFARREGECVVGAFSPLRPEKNLARLVRAFAALPAMSQPVRLVICGDGPERQRLTKLADSLGVRDRATFTGHVPNSEAAMGDFDVFAITSDTEQMPYAVLEAMAARRPVLGTAVGDIPVMVSEENQPFIVPRDDPGRLVRALTGLCRNEGLRHRLGEANRTEVEKRFALAPMIEAFRRVFMRALAERSRKLPASLGGIEG